MILRASFVGLIGIFTASVAMAGPTVECKGTLVQNPLGDESGDKMKAIQSTFTYRPNEETGVGTFSLELGKLPKFDGEAKETGNPQFPMEFSGKDPDGKQWVGNVFPVERLIPADTMVHMLLDMRNSEVQLSGPLSCTVK